jgi:hypothetical protein
MLIWTTFWKILELLVRSKEKGSSRHKGDGNMIPGKMESQHDGRLLLVAAQR